VRFDFDSLGLGPLIFFDDETPAGVGQTEQKIEKATDEAQAAAEKHADKLKKLIEKCKEKCLDPKATGAEKLAVINFVKEQMGEIMEVTDQWLSLESAFRELEEIAKTSSATPPTEDPTVSPTVTPPGDSLAAEDKTAPVQIPVPSEVQATTPAPSGNPLSRLWRAIW
jgi:hypothetical protein